MLASIALASGVEVFRQMGWVNRSNEVKLRRISQRSEELANPSAADALKTEPVRIAYSFDADETEIIRDGLRYLGSLSEIKIIKTAREKSLASAATRLSLYLAAVNESGKLDSQELSHHGWQ